VVSVNWVKILLNSVTIATKFHLLLASFMNTVSSVSSMNHTRSVTLDKGCVDQCHLCKVWMYCSNLHSPVIKLQDNDSAFLLKGA